MSSARALRLLNSVEIGTTNSTQLEALLSSSSGRLPELNVLFGVSGQAGRIAMSQKTVETLVNSNTSLSALIESGVLITAIANSPAARVAVKSSGAGVMRRLMQSRWNTEDVNSKWADDYAWTRQNLPTLGTTGGLSATATWKAITYGDKYVAVGYASSSAATSTDGTTWTVRQLPLTLNYSSVCYGGPVGNLRYVAVAENTTTYIRSDDGIVWTAGQLPKLANWKHVYFRDGKFTAIAKGSTEVATSVDGIVWTMASSNNLFTQTLAITGGAQGSAVTLSLSGSGTATVPAGVTTLNVTGRGGASDPGDTNTTIDATMPSSTSWSEVIYAAGKFVAVSRSGKIAYSADGVVWANSSYTGTNEWYTVAYGDGLFVALGYLSTTSAYSTDGINWSVGTLPSAYAWSKVAYGNGRYVAVNSTNSAVTAVSTNGIGWSAGSITGVPAGDSIRSICFALGKFIAIGASKAYQSTDGLTWTNSSLGQNGNWAELTYGNGLFVAIYENASVCAYSADGVTWAFGVTPTVSGAFGWYGLAFGNGVFVMTDGQSGNIAYSSNGVTWSIAGGFDAVSRQTVCYGNGRFVTVGFNSSSVLLSVNGSAWSRRYVPTVGYSASVTVNGVAYTYAGTTSATPPASRTDTIVLSGSTAQAFTYNCPVGTLVSATFIASDVTIPATGNGVITIPAGTAKLNITSRGAQGSVATKLAIPSTAGDPNWDAIAYGNGVYVVVRGSAAVALNTAYSTDGLTWTKGAMPGGATGWTDITYGNGKFVAVRTSATDQIFAYSSDGIVWSVVTPTVLSPVAAGNWKKVTYGGGRFVAVGSGTSANVLYSSDGINWTTSLITGGLAWTSVVYGGDRFVAVSYDSAATGANNIAYSVDGITWTRTGLTGDTTARFQGIAFGGGKWLAVGNKQVTSNDGITWTVIGAAKSLTNVMYLFSQFVAFSAETSELNPSYSVDNGATWTQSSLGGGSSPSGRFKIAALGASRLVSIATADAQIAYTTDGRNWLTSMPASTGGNTIVTIAGIPYTFYGSTGASVPATRTEEVALNVNGVTTVNYSVATTAACTFAYSGGGSTQVVNTLVTLGSTAYNGSNKFVAVAYDEHTVANSADGINWTVATMPANVSWRSVSYGNGVFVAVAYDTSIAASSTDGVNWTQRALPTSTKWGSIAYGAAGGHVTMAEFSSINATSADGITWVQRVMVALPTTTIESGQLTNVPLSGTGSVTIPIGTTSVTINGRGAAGTSEVTTPIYGPDGSTWTKNLGLDTASDWTALAFGGTKFVAAKSGTTVAAYSTDGITWTTVTLPFANTWTRTVYANGKFVMIGTTLATTSILYSTDGITWTAATQPSTGRWEGIVYGGSKFVAVNSEASDNLTSSADGITWTRGSINSGTSAWRAVAYGTGKFVAVGSAASNNVGYSVDGISWTVITAAGLVGGMRDVIFGGSKFMAVETSGIGVTASPDGTVWTRAVIAGYAGKQSPRLMYAGGKYTIFGNSTANGVADILRSSDGLTWTAANTTGSTVWNDGVYVTGKYVLVGNGVTTSVGISSDIVTGSQVTSPAVTGTGASVAINSVSYSYAGSNTSAVPSSRADIVSLSSSIANTVTYSAGVGTDVYLTYVALASGSVGVTPTLPIQASWIDAAYGNGVFVALATGSAIAATSEDGVSWTQRTMPVSTQWSSISFSNGIFVALSATGSIGATSSDGITWVQKSLPQIETAGGGNVINTVLVNNGSRGELLKLPYSANWRAITYGNGMFVALSPNIQNTAVYSTDGVTWNTSALMEYNMQWFDVTFGNGMFVATSPMGRKTAYSTDAINWTIGNIATSVEQWSSVTFGGGKFVAASSSSNQMAYSTDGINWTTVTTPKVGGCSTITYGNGKFLALDSSTNANNGVYSADGITWVATTLPSTSQWLDVVYGNGVFVAIAASSTVNRAAYSSDGITWSVSTMPSPNNWLSIAFGGGKFVAVSTNNGKAAYSVDGITWIEITMPTTISWTNAAYGNGLFLAISGSDQIAISTDGITWSNQAPPTSGSVTVPVGIQQISLTGQGSPGVAGMAADSALKNTIGGGVVVQLPVTGNWGSVIYGNGVYLAFNDSGSCARSTDAITWTTQAMPVGNSWKTAAYGCGRFVAISKTSNQMSHSLDGITWTLGTWPSGKPALTSTDGGWYAITFGDYITLENSTGRFIAIAPGTNQFAQSTDGVNWTMITQYTTGNWGAMAFGNNKFVGISYSSTSCVESTEGLVWNQRTLPLNRRWYTLAFGNGRFVALSYDTAEIIHSTDGVTWTIGSISIGAQWTGLAYGGGKFVAVGQIPGTFAYSTDGITWIVSNAIPNMVLNTVTYGNGKFVAVSYGDKKVIQSADGTTWTDASLNTSGTVTIPAGVTSIIVSGYGSRGKGSGVNNLPVRVYNSNYSYRGPIVYTNGKYLAYIAGMNTVCSSSDGYTWAVNTMSFSGAVTSNVLDVSCISYQNGRYISLNSSVSATSTDGINWVTVQNTTVTSTANWAVPAYGNGKYITVANAYVYTLVSTDGINWAQGAPSSDLPYIAFGKGRFITTGNHAQFSTDGVTWNILPALYSTMTRTGPVSFTNDLFICFSMADSKVSTSTDGVTWNTVSIPVAYSTWSTVVYGNGVYVTYATTRTSEFLYSYNGSTWFASALPVTGVTIRGIVFDGTRFYATAISGQTIYSSVDGINWTTAVNWDIGESNNLTLGGVTYVYPGVVGNTTPVPKTDVITLSGSSATTASFSIKDGGLLQLGYTAVIQGEALVISVNGTNYTYPGSFTTGPAIARTDVINGLGATSTVINYSIKNGKAGSLYYSDAVTNLSHAAWASSAYGSGLTAAVSSTGTHAATTPDGTVWTKRALPTGIQAADVVYGNGLFVAIGSSNKAATSSDGITWSQRTMPESISYRSIAYGNGKYVSVASGGLSASAAAISVDGITWASVILPVIADWRSIAFKDGLFFAVAANTDKAITSPDGVIWTIRTLPATANWAAVTNSDKKFVLIANGSTVGAVSFNGATFNQSGPGNDTLAGSSANSRWNLVSYGASVFVALAKESTVAAVSADGINWTPRTLPADTTWNALTYGNGKFVAMAENTTVGAYSADGSNWLPTTLPVSQRWNSVVAGPRLFVAIAKDSSVYMTSKDGITWTARNLPETGTWTTVRYGSGRYVVTNDATTRVCVSADGINWTMSDTSSAGLVSLTYGNGVFVGVATNDAGVDVSSDGYNWTQYGLPSISDWSAIRYGNGVFVAIAYNNAIVATSIDGVTWKQTNLPAAANWKNVAYGNGIFLGISDSSTAVTNC